MRLMAIVGGRLPEHRCAPRTEASAPSLMTPLGIDPSFGQSSLVDACPLLAIADRLFAFRCSSRSKRGSL